MLKINWNKSWPNTETDELLNILDVLNLIMIEERSHCCRMGHEKMASILPNIVKIVHKAGKHVVWTCDPMHGNTIKSNTGYKTRPLKDIISEIHQFFQIHRAEGTYPGGVHLEMTGQDVTECMGGLQEISDKDLENRYHTYCDPRLNASQSLELAFLLSDFLKEEKLLSKQSSNL